MKFYEHTVSNETIGTADIVVSLSDTVMRIESSLNAWLDWARESYSDPGMDVWRLGEIVAPRTMEELRSFGVSRGTPLNNWAEKLHLPGAQPVMISSQTLRRFEASFENWRMAAATKYKEAPTETPFPGTPGANKKRKEESREKKALLIGGLLVGVFALYKGFFRFTENRRKFLKKS